MKLSKHQRGLLDYILTERLPRSEVRTSTYNRLKQLELVRLEVIEGVEYVVLTDTGKPVAEECAAEIQRKFEAWNASIVRKIES